MILKSCKGAITVFQSIILICLIVLIGLLIDISRILVAERKVESAIKSATRSVISSYDCDLVGDYGLFAIDGSFIEKNGRAEFLKYLKLNMNHASNTFNYIVYHLDDTDENTYIRGFMHISDSDVLKAQIIDYMKYKAPITMTETIIDKFRASGIFKKLEFSKREKIVREKRKILKDRINEANSLLSEIKELENTKSMENIKRMLSVLNDLQEINTSIVGPLEEYYEAKSESLNLVEELKSADPEIHINTVNNSEFDKVMASSTQLKSEIELNRTKIEDIISVVERLQEKRQELLHQLQSLEDEYNYLEELIQLIRKDIEFINLIKRDIEMLNTKIKKLEEELDVLNENYVENKNKIMDMQHELNSLKELLENSETKLEEFGTIDQLELNLQNAYNDLKHINAGIDNIRQEINMIEVQISDVLNNFELYGLDLIEANEPENDLSDKPIDQGERMKFVELKEELLSKEGKYLRYITDEILITYDNPLGLNMEEYKELSSTSSSESEAEADNDGVMGFLNSVQRIFNATYEKTLLVEYILDRFTYFTSNVERGHYFHKGEAEYILWGKVGQLDNIVRTMSTVWFLRFAVNSIDQFAVSKNPHPGYRLIYSLGKGFINSCNDVYLLLRGKFINISPSVKSVKLNYPDHLRVLLLLQSIVDEKAQLNNIAQLIQANVKQHNRDFDITNHSTVIYSRVRVKMKLWFLPLLHIDKIGFSKFEGGCYIIDKETYIGF